MPSGWRPIRAASQETPADLDDGNPSTVTDLDDGNPWRSEVERLDVRERPY